MASPAQIAANRSNALRSTGPRTPEGKDASRRNALTHGMTAETLALPEGAEEAEAVARRVEEWTPSFRPRDGRESWLLRQAVVSSLQVEHCQEQERALRSRAARRASLRWDEDRRDAAEALGAKLGKNPALVSRELCHTKQGVSWMIARWESLLLVLDSEADWDASQRRHALDLLAIPAEFRTGPTPLDGDKDTRHALILAEIARLNRLISGGLDELDAQERTLAEQGICLLADKQVTLARRYESAWSRREARAIQELRQLTRPAKIEPDSLELASRDLARERAEHARLSRAFAPSSVIPPPPAVPRPIAPAARPANPAENRRTRRAREALARRA